MSISIYDQFLFLLLWIMSQRNWIRMFQTWLSMWWVNMQVRKHWLNCHLEHWKKKSNSIYENVLICIHEKLENIFSEIFKNQLYSDLWIVKNSSQLKVYRNQSLCFVEEYPSKRMVYHLCISFSQHKMSSSFLLKK